MRVHEAVAKEAGEVLRCSLEGCDAGRWLEAVAHAFFPRLAVRWVMISHMLLVEGAEIATVSWIFDIQLLATGN